MRPMNPADRRGFSGLARFSLTIAMVVAGTGPLQVLAQDPAGSMEMAKPQRWVRNLTAITMVGAE